MAKVKGPLNSIQASGTVNNVIYARNHYGAYARSYASPSQPDSAEQLLWRGAIQTINTAWQNPAVITPAAFQLWQQFASAYTVPDRYGYARKLSAKEWYVKFNIYRIRAGLSVVQYPPVNPGCYYFPEITFFWDSGGIYVEVWPRPTGQNFVLVSYTGPHNHTRNFAPQSTTFGVIYDSSSTSPEKVVDSASIDANPHNWFFRIVVVDAFGRPSNKVWFKVYTNGSAPPSTQVFDDTNLIRSLNPTLVDQNPNVARAFEDASFDRKSLVQIVTTTWNYSEVSKSWLYFYLAGETVSYVNFFNAIQSWVPAQTTWNEYSSGNSWSSAGGAQGTDYASSAFAVFNQPGLDALWVRLEITDQMNSWLGAATDPIAFWVAPNYVEYSDLRWNDGSAASNKAFVLNVPIVS